jgi:pSer/pThr/pTyr-binding forkhead associated (FHA) protein
MLRELDSTDTEPRERDVLAGPEGLPPAPPQGPQASTTFIGQPNQSPTVAVLQLASTGGPTTGRTFVVDERGATVGRLPECSIFIPDERLSRQHAAIQFRDGGFWLSDLGSRNGTAVNGTLVKVPQLLRNGDSIELGASLLVVKFEGDH